MMSARLTPISLAAALVVSLAAQAQTQRAVTFLPNAILTHTSNALTVEARDPRPLLQAVYGIRTEYGWRVDYEDPIFTGSDLVDDTAPAWRASHPGEPGVTIPAGQQFKCNIQFVPDGGKVGAAAEESALKQMADAYAQSGNPGKFKLVSEANDRFALVGITDAMPDGLFGVKITLPRQKRSVALTVADILQATSNAVGKKIGLGFAPFGIFAQNEVELGGENVPARELLAHALDSTYANLVWEANYNADLNLYLVNIGPALKSYYDLKGQRQMQLVPR